MVFVLEMEIKILNRLVMRVVMLEITGIWSLWWYQSCNLRQFFCSGLGRIILLFCLCCSVRFMYVLYQLTSVSCMLFNICEHRHSILLCNGIHFCASTFLGFSLGNHFMYVIPCRPLVQWLYTRNPDVFFCNLQKCYCSCILHFFRCLQIVHVAAECGDTFKPINYASYGRSFHSCRFVQRVHSVFLIFLLLLWSLYCKQDHCVTCWFNLCYRLQWKWDFEMLLVYFSK